MKRGILRWKQVLYMLIRETLLCDVLQTDGQYAESVRISFKNVSNLPIPSEKVALRPVAFLAVFALFPQKRKSR